MEKVIALLIAAYAAKRYGVAIGHDYWTSYDPANASLYGLGSVFIATLLVTLFVFHRVATENLVSLGFAGFMAYWFGIPAGYRYWGMHDDVGAAMYGGGSVFMVAWIAGILVVWPFVRNITNASRTATDNSGRGMLAGIKWLYRRLRGTASAKEQNDAIETGDRLIYKGMIDRDYTYIVGRTKKERVRAPFTLERHTRAMPPREREALSILRELKLAGLDRKSADNLDYALTWGDGRCQIYIGNVNLDSRNAQQNGIKASVDLVKQEASHRGVSVEGAISELFTRLQMTAQRSKKGSRIANVWAQYQTPDQGPELA